MSRRAGFSKDVSKGRHAMTRFPGSFFVGACVLLGVLWAVQVSGCAGVDRAAAQAKVQASFDSGMSALAAGDKKSAAGHFREAAQSGHAEAAYCLGLLSRDSALAANPAEALKWMRQSAEQGFAPAQEDLGVWYLAGPGGAKNPAEAARWFRKAADKGSAGSMYLLGGMYARGNGVEKNPEWALRWIQHAAARGFPVPAEYLSAEGIERQGRARQ
jgi:TPR repeat protein